MRKSIAAALLLCLDLSEAGFFRHKSTKNEEAIDTGAPIDGVNPDFGFDESEYISTLAKRLQPRPFQMTGNVLHPHQFLHLHHMKTGGTSMDGLLRCAMGRLQRQPKDSERDVEILNIPYMNVHECSERHYRSCVDKTDQGRCAKQVNESAFLSYCAPVCDLPTFGWRETEGEFRRDGEADLDEDIKNKPIAVTVIRHPVDRVWSMFRFQTKGCFKCMNLTDIYQAIDENRTDEITNSKICFDQLQNHQVHNMITSLDSDDWLGQAKKNLREFFTMVGLTENMAMTHKVRNTSSHKFRVSVLIRFISTIR